MLTFRNEPWPDGSGHCFVSAHRKLFGFWRGCPGDGIRLVSPDKRAMKMRSIVKCIVEGGY